MLDPGFFKGKKITVVGLARSGAASARLLERLGALVSVTEKKDDTQMRGLASSLPGAVRVELGGHSEQYIDGSDLVVVSPGVPLDAAPVAWARRLTIPVISEIEVGWRLCPGRVIAVTGSNGKSTTATLIGKVLEAGGRKSWVCGNIGTPFCSVVEEVNADDIVVLEVSSYQLETIQNFKPWIAVILNITRNHLDHYPGMQEYIDAKKRICANQDKNDHLVLNAADPLLRQMQGSVASNVVFFSASQGFNPDQAAVAAVASLAGISTETCAKVFSGFKGLEHRMEKVCRVNGVDFINDSKATTVESAIWALENIEGRVVWIAGGRDKGVDYSIARSLAGRKVKHLVLIGEAAGLIRSALGGVVSCQDASSMEEAVAKAYALSSSGETVLLSPMCSSFDMFKDFEERGRVFKKAVEDAARRSS